MGEWRKKIKANKWFSPSQYIIVVMLLKWYSWLRIYLKMSRVKILTKKMWCWCILIATFQAKFRVYFIWNWDSLSYAMTAIWISIFVWITAMTITLMKLKLLTPCQWDQPSKCGKLYPLSLERVTLWSLVRVLVNVMIKSPAIGGVTCEKSTAHIGTKESAFSKSFLG